MTTASTVLPPKFGPPAGVPVGTMFKSREALRASGVHSMNFAGIAASEDGATSIVFSQEYEDDEQSEDGMKISYTGAGGRGERMGARWGATGPQTEDQTFDHPHNNALLLTYENGLPLRVTRRVTQYTGRPGKLKAELYYRYDGLYSIESVKYDKGKSGYMICQFFLQRIPGQPRLPDYFD